MKFSAHTEYWYEPDIGDNLKAPESERLAALIRRPDRETRRELAGVQTIRDYARRDLEDTERDPAKLKDTDSRKVTVILRPYQNTGRILREFVAKLRNCQVEQLDAKGEAPKLINITTGAELALSTGYGMDRLVDLLVAEVLRDELPETARKNSESASNSS